MINTPTPQRRMTIEEAIATGLPVDGRNHLDAYKRSLTEDVRTLIDNMLGQGLPHISANPTRLSWRFEHPSMVIAQVDIDDYLRVYQELLDNPANIQRYLEILNPNARSYLEERARTAERLAREHPNSIGALGAPWEAETYEAQCIRSLFGLGEGTSFRIGLPQELSRYERIQRREPIMDFIQEVEDRDIERINAEYQIAHTNHDWSNYRGPEFTPLNFRFRRQMEYLSAWEQEGTIEIDMMGQTQSPTGTNHARDQRMLHELRTFVDGLRRFDDVREIVLLSGDEGVMAPTYNRE
jgi:hypothetical protein